MTKAAYDKIAAGLEEVLEKLRTEDMPWLSQDWVDGCIDPDAPQQFVGPALYVKPKGWK